MAKMMKKLTALFLSLVLILGQLAIPVIATTEGVESTDPATGEQTMEITTTNDNGQVTAEIVIEASGDYTPGAVTEGTPDDTYVVPELNAGASGEIVTVQTNTEYSTQDGGSQPLVNEEILNEPMTDAELAGTDLFAGTGEAQNPPAAPATPDPTYTDAAPAGDTAISGDAIQTGDFVADPNGTAAPENVTLETDAVPTESLTMTPSATDSTDTAFASAAVSVEDVLNLIGDQNLTLPDGMTSGSDASVTDLKALLEANGYEVDDSDPDALKVSKVTVGAPNVGADGILADDDAASQLDATPGADASWTEKENSKSVEPLNDTALDSLVGAASDFADIDASTKQKKEVTKAEQTVEGGKQNVYTVKTTTEKTQTNVNTLTDEAAIKSELAALGITEVEGVNAQSWRTQTGFGERSVTPAADPGVTDPATQTVTTVSGPDGDIYIRTTIETLADGTVRTLVEEFHPTVVLTDTFKVLDIDSMTVTEEIVQTQEQTDKVYSFTEKWTETTTVNDSAVHSQSNDASKVTYVFDVVNGKVVITAYKGELLGYGTGDTAGDTSAVVSKGDKAGEATDGLNDPGYWEGTNDKDAGISINLGTQYDRQFNSGEYILYRNTYLRKIEGENGEVRWVYSVQNQAVEDYVRNRTDGPEDENIKGKEYTAKEYTENDPTKAQEYAANIPELETIAKNGYWGTTSGMGSLDAVNTLLRQYYRDEWSEKDVVQLSAYEAICATQAAFWKYATENGYEPPEGYNLDNLTHGNGQNDEQDRRISYLRDLLIELAEATHTHQKADGTVVADNSATNDVAGTTKVYNNEEITRNEDLNNAKLETASMTVNSTSYDAATQKTTNNVDVSFKLDVSHSVINGNLIVKVIQNGENVAAYRLADDGTENQGLLKSALVNGVDKITGTTPLRPDANGNYTLTGLTLGDGVPFTIQIAGTQNLGEGLIVYENAAMEDLLSLATMTNNVDLQINMKLSVTNGEVQKTTQEGSVTSTQNVTYERKFERSATRNNRNEVKGNPEVTSTEGTRTVTVTGEVTVEMENASSTRKVTTETYDYTPPVVDPPVDPPVNPPAPPVDPPVPPVDPPAPPAGGGGGGHVPMIMALDIPDEPVPMVHAPEELMEDGEFVEIEDEEVPLADAPSTGDASLIWAAMSVMSMGGYVFLGKKDAKKRREGKFLKK